jgi:hypothetical protein
LLLRWMAKGKWSRVLEKGKGLKTSEKQIGGLAWPNLIEGIARGVGDRKGLEDWKIAQ